MGSSSNEPQSWGRRIVNILLVILLGAVGSGVWSLLFQPGFLGGKRALLNVITFGIAAARDSAYQSAALDPTPLTPLILLLSAGCLVALFTGGFWGIKSGEFIENRWGSAGEGDGRISVQRRQIKTFIALGLIFIHGFFLASAVSFTITNQAVLVWRTFNANVEILSPYVPHMEEQLLRSNFRQVRTKADYQKIDGRMRALATQYKIKLWEPSLW